jgi:hypothetical protein
MAALGGEELSVRDRSGGDRAAACRGSIVMPWVRGGWVDPSGRVLAWVSAERFGLQAGHRFGVGASLQRIEPFGAGERWAKLKPDAHLLFAGIGKLCLVPLATSMVLSEARTWRVPSMSNSACPASTSNGSSRGDVLGPSGPARRSQRRACSRHPPARRTTPSPDLTPRSPAAAHIASSDLP